MYELGSSIPPHNPFGESLADDDCLLTGTNAVSVSLPTWSSNILYEEGDPAVHAALKSGYPRFVYHPSVKQLFTECEAKFAKTFERCLVFPSRRCASECRDFIKRLSPSLAPQTDLDVLTICNTVRIAEFTLMQQHSATSPKASDPIAHLISGPVVLFIVLFDQRLARVAKQFWQHSGEGISTRFAVFCLNIIAKNRRSIEFSGTSPDSWSAQKYLQFPNNADDQKFVQEHARRVASESEMDVFVEERYGRNLDLRMVQHAQTVLKKRIAGLLGDEGSQTSPASSVPQFRNMDALTEAEVFLFPCGMSAIYNAHRAILHMRPNKQTAQFGFPYLDTLKIQERFGAGCQFFGTGDEADLDLLEAQLDSGEASISALFCEFPSNPLLKSSNLARIRSLADRHGFLVVVDETIGNFVNVAVLEWADVVVSSLTKIFSGDCNVMGGSMILNPAGKYFADLSKSMEVLYENNLWCEDAIFLELQKIHYPLFTTRANYDAVKRQGGGYGGLLSIILEDEEAAKNFYDRLNVAKGPSLGTNFTLASPYTILAHYTELDWAKEFDVCRWLVRVSVGLEETEGLVKLFADALI
ncbi:hypothetical protein HDU67_008902 [Dinochytrium kinnereticum]|nr:hypothetical protein HDU67_008902 [Dinochytrium kinnereticum]